MEANILRSKLSDVAIPTDISLADYILNGIDQHGDKIAMVSIVNDNKIMGELSNKFKSVH